MRSLESMRPGSQRLIRNPVYISSVTVGVFGNRLSRMVEMSGFVKPASMANALTATLVSWISESMVAVLFGRPRRRASAFAYVLPRAGKQDPNQAKRFSRCVPKIKNAANGRDARKTYRPMIFGLKVMRRDTINVTNE